MQNHYKTLGLTNAASAAEIRRAYRVLARRYHPDVNPDGANDEIFKAIALAYSVLSDTEKRRQHDLDLKQGSESVDRAFERAHEALRKNQQAAAYARQQREASAKAAQKRTTQPGSSSDKSSTAEVPPRRPQVRATATKQARPSTFEPPRPGSKLQRASSTLQQLAEAPRLAVEGLRRAVAFARDKASVRNLPTLKQFALVEVSVSIQDAIKGCRRTVEIESGQAAQRKVSVTIPPGIQSGSVIRLRSKERPDSELAVIVKVENHPWLSLAERGLTMEIPLTIQEAMEGARIQVPSLGEPLLVTVEPLTQSGREVRLRNQGIVQRDGSRGDLYIRFIVMIPSSPLPPEVQSLTELLSEIYETPVRAHLPVKLFEE